MLKTQAIVIKEVNYRDNDKMLTLFSPEHGRIDALSRGCRKSTAKLLAASQLFICGEFQFSLTKEKYYLAGCEIAHSFFDLRKAYENLFIAQYFLETVNLSIMPGQADKPLFFLLINALYALEKGLSPSPYIMLAFQLKFAEAIGFRPVLDACVSCGKGEAHYLCVEAGGLVCGGCISGAKGLKTRLTHEEIKQMRRILDAPSKAIRETNEFTPSERLVHFMNNYIEEKTDFQIKSYQVLKQINQN